MSTDHFLKICNKEGLIIPAKDVDVRKLLANAGAVVLETKSKDAIALRREHAAAVLWAQKYLDKEAAWSKLKNGPRDTLLALYPVKAKFIDKGGDAWISPCRSLIHATVSPPPSPMKKGPKGKGARLDKGSRSDCDEESDGEAEPESVAKQAKVSESGKKRPAEHMDSASDSDAGPSKKAPPGHKKAKGQVGKSGKPGKAVSVSSGSEDEALSPYLSSRELLAVLPAHRKDQLFLGRTWTGAQLAEREKILERILRRGERGGRFEDPDKPMWAQRITIARGPGSAFSDAEVSQDGRNLASMLRWDSAQLLYSRSDWEGTHRLQQRASRVAEAWERIKTGARSGMAPPSALLTPIFRAVFEVLDQRLASATGELVDAGRAGEEILGDMARQKREVTELFRSYEDYLAAVYSGGPSFQTATMRAISVWYGLLAPVVATLSPDSSPHPGGCLAAQAEAAFGMVNAGNGDEGSGGDLVELELIDELPSGSPQMSPTAGSRSGSPDSRLPSDHSSPLGSVSSPRSSWGPAPVTAGRLIGAEGNEGESSVAHPRPAPRPTLSFPRFPAPCSDGAGKSLGGW